VAAALAGRGRAASRDRPRAMSAPGHAR
jgi:hypothetical protein